jgi:hypothetical protein
MLEMMPSLLAHTVVACKMHSSVPLFVSVLEMLKLLFLEAVKAMGGSTRTTWPAFKSIVALTAWPLGPVKLKISILPIHIGIYFGGADGMRCNTLASFLLKLKRSPVQCKSSFFSTVKDFWLMVLHNLPFKTLQHNSASPKYNKALVKCNTDLPP